MLSEMGKHMKGVTREPNPMSLKLCLYAAKLPQENITSFALPFQHELSSLIQVKSESSQIVYYICHTLSKHYFKYLCMLTLWITETHMHTSIDP